MHYVGVNAQGMNATNLLNELAGSDVVLLVTVYPLAVGRK